MSQPWLAHYSSRAQHIQRDGLPHDPKHTLIDMFETATHSYASQTAFTNMGHNLSYQQLHEDAHAFAAYCQSLGLHKGDKIALMMPNILQYPVALFGGMLAGMTIVNVNPLYTPRELKHQLNDAEVSAIVIVDNFMATLEAVIADTSVKYVINTQLGDMFSPIKRMLVNTVVKRVKKMVPSFTLRPHVSFRHAIAQGKAMKHTAVTLVPEDIAFLQYTGGTTGPSKGAMLTHASMMANLAQVSVFLDEAIEAGKETVVTALPLYHIFALQASCLLFMHYGARSILITNPRDMDGLMKTLKKTPFSIFPAVNTLFNGLVNHPDFAGLDFSRFKFGLGGGMAVQKAVADKWEAITKTPLLEGYGLTETSPVATMNPLSIDAYTGAISIPLPHTDVKIVNEDNIEVAVGEPGEICIKGPQVMAGYYKRPDATAETIIDGWLHTGDIAKMDEQGYLYIVDRKKDMILVSGFNVYPNEIEEVAVMLDGVLEAAAVGEPHPNSGEVVKLFVVLKDATITAEAIIAHCKANLTGYKVPKSVVFLDELPKTNVGKILRRELR